MKNATSPPTTESGRVTTRVGKAEMPTAMPIKIADACQSTAPSDQ